MKNSKIVFVALLALSIGFVGCKKKDDSNGSTSTTSTTSTTGTTTVQKNTITVDGTSYNLDDQMRYDGAAGDYYMRGSGTGTVQYIEALVNPKPATDKDYTVIYGLPVAGSGNVQLNLQMGGVTYTAHDGTAHIFAASPDSTVVKFTDVKFYKTGATTVTASGYYVCIN